MTTSSDLENGILSNNKGITILVATEKEYYQTMKNTVKKVVEHHGHFVSDFIIMTNPISSIDQTCLDFRRHLKSTSCIVHQ